MQLKFVRKTPMKAHARLVDRLFVKAQLADSGGNDAQMWTQRFYLPLNLPTRPEMKLPIFSQEFIDIDYMTHLPVNHLDKTSGKSLNSTSPAPPIPRKSELRTPIVKTHLSSF